MFHSIEFIPAKELPNKEYPLILSTGRLLYHYNSGTMTRKVDGLNRLADEVIMEIHPADAEEKAIADNGVVRIRSRRGEITCRARITKTSPQGIVFIPFHFGETAVNLLTIDTLDPVARIPEFKICAVAVEPVS